MTSMLLITIDNMATGTTRVAVGEMMTGEEDTIEGSIGVGTDLFRKPA